MNKISFLILAFFVLANNLFPGYAKAQETIMITARVDQSLSYAEYGHQIFLVNNIKKPVSEERQAINGTIYEVYSLDF